MMASTNGGAYGRDVTSGEGLEVDLSAAGLHELPESLGIEATPRELLSRPGTRIRRNPEKELAHDSDLKIPFGSRSSLKSKGVLLLLVATIIIIVIVLAVAVPLALRLRKPSKPSPSVISNSTTRGPNELPTSGAFNGTGLAYIDLDPTGVPDLSLFYQDYKSQIRRLHSIEVTPLSSGFPVVASNARNATPLTTRTYATNNGELNSHLYYIDINDTLQELFSTDNLTTWQLGSLGDYHFTASNSSTALTAFYRDTWLGQDKKSIGIRLYYGAPDNRVHELALFPNVGSQYFSQFVFPGTNGNAGFSSAWWDGPGLGNLYVFDENNEFQVWSNDFNNTPEATQNASYGKWVEGPTETNYSIQANTALSFGAVGTPPSSGGELCFQQTSDEIKCASISSSDGSLLPPADVSNTNPAPAVPGFQPPQQGSALLVAWLPTPGTFPWELNVFYQTNSSDIIQNADATGTWVNSTLSVR